MVKEDLSEFPDRFFRRFLKLKAFYYPATYLFWSEGI